MGEGCVKVIFCIESTYVGEEENLLEAEWVREGVVTSTEVFPRSKQE